MLEGYLELLNNEEELDEEIKRCSSKYPGYR